MGFPTHVDRYEIGEVIGSGAMGTVRLAWDPKLHREVAIKILRTEVSTDRKVRTRFGREARAVAALRHPNIVEIYDYSGEDSEYLYIVMEKLEGDDLFNIVAENGAMPEPAAAAVGHELCLALNVAHEANIIHRDMKPENVFISPSGRVVLTDFGIVKAIDESAAIDGGGKATDIIGTPGFMPPELMMNKGLGPFTDVFALGALLYNVATGQLPFDGPGPVEIFRKMMAGEFEDPRLHNSYLSDEFCQVLAGSLEPKPKKRIQTVAEVRQGLKEVLANAGVTDLRDDMRDYMASPEDYREAASRRSADHLLRRIKIATKDKNFQLAEDLRLRLAILDPQNREVHEVTGLMKLPTRPGAEDPGDEAPDGDERRPSGGASAPRSLGGKKLVMVGAILVTLAVAAAAAFFLWPSNLPETTKASGDAAAATGGGGETGDAAGEGDQVAGDNGSDPGGAGTAVAPTPDDQATAGAKGTVEVIFKGTPGTLFLDGDRIARVKKKKVLEVAAGEHLFEGRAPGFKAKKRIMVIGDNTLKVVIELRRERITYRQK